LGQRLRSEGLERIEAEVTDVHGAIYRIAPKGFKSVVPRLDLATPAGAAAALRNPAVHVRHLGFNALKAFGSKALPETLELLRDANPYVAARAVWLLPHLGEEGVARTRERLTDAHPVQRQLAFRALRAAGHDPLPIAAALASDADVAVRRDVATSLLGAPADKALPVIVELARRLDVADKNSVAAFGIAARGKEDAVWSAVRKALAAPSAEAWSPQLARIAWILHPADALADLRARAGSPKLDAAQRSLALETISFIESREAALATIALSAEGSPVKDEAARWALMRMTGSWSEFDVRSELKKAGVYDPAKIVVTPVVVPEPAAASAYSVKDVLAKQGDSARGAQLVQRCTMCHQVGGNGPGSYAPELKGFVDRQGREAAVRSIVEPSDAIALGYEGVTVRLKKDAGQIDGRLLSGNDPLVIISTGGATQMVPRDRMAGQSRMTRSLMLSADQLGLTAQDVADIVEWMSSYR
ncbi:MAG: c-type cytochrome, partial [Verrucomicrobiota bacterium]